ncbi:MAG: transketolase [Planctomycetota bacterium]|nr:transketolase [Planctomycetota bacterium]
METPIQELEAIARRIRGRLVEMSHAARAPHLGSSLSCVDILAAAYWGPVRVDPQRAADPWRDRFILSKGHAAAALYAVLAERGFFPQDWLDSFGQPGSRLPEQMSPKCVPGVEVATGSLGHGLSLGAGMALAGRIQRRDYRVWVVLGDGECNEGSVWEAAMFAAARQLTNLFAVVDYNRWQATGRSEEVLALQPLADKWAAFGWRVTEVDGHDVDALRRALTQRAQAAEGPACIIAHTVKGRGVSFMEDDNNWHYRIPTAEEVEAVRAELGLVGRSGFPA